MDHYESIRAVEVRVMALEQAHNSLEAKVDANTRITSSIKDDTGDLIEFARTAKGLITFCRWVGKLVGWAAPIVAAVYAAWMFFKGGK